jgi:ribonuclease H-related protein
MGYKHEEELREKAQTFIQILLQAGIAVESYPAMFRDYMVKLAVNGAGHISIYYSPKQQTFSLKLHELQDTRLMPQIEACWRGDSINSDESLPKEGYQAYVDGSYISGCVGYGAVILHQNQEIRRFSGSVEHDVEQRQVVGELQATMQVLRWCEENNILDIEVFYDYEGIQKWAAGEWRANNAATQHYQQTVQASPVRVIWQKVKSHSGVHWNDVVDELAKQGALAQSRDAFQSDDPVVVLEKKAIGFLAYLASQNIEAEYTRIYNEQYARIIIERGYFDLYNTRKRPMSPYIHNFKDGELQKHIEHLWQQFHTGIAEEIAVSEVSGFEEVEYFLSVLAPYRHLGLSCLSIVMMNLSIFTGKLRLNND